MGTASIPATTAEGEEATRVCYGLDADLLPAESFYRVCEYTLDGDSAVAAKRLISTHHTYEGAGREVLRLRASAAKAA